MVITLKYNNRVYHANLDEPNDLSVSLGAVKCFFAPDLKISPFQSGDFIGSVKAGGPVNFFNVAFNPHGNGTHTESLGHITIERESINRSLSQFHFIAKLISVALKKKGKSDLVVTLHEVVKECADPLPEALIIRTLPNPKSKRKQNYSGKNPPYVEMEAINYLTEKGVKHLLIDLPSVDREEDDGMLASHRAFWKIGGGHADADARRDCTITELIYVDEEVRDGLYLLNMQFAPIELDASPSRPVIYALNQEEPEK